MCACASFFHTLSLFLYNFILSFFSIHYIVGSLTSPPTAPPTSPLTAEIIVFPTEYQAVAMPDVSPSTPPLTSPPTAPRLATNFGTMMQHTESQSITFSSRNKYTTSLRQSGYTIGRKKMQVGITGSISRANVFYKKYNHTPCGMWYICCGRTGIAKSTTQHSSARKVL